MKFGVRLRSWRNPTTLFPGVILVGAATALGLSQGWFGKPDGPGGKHVAHVDYRPWQSPRDIVIQAAPADVVRARGDTATTPDGSVRVRLVAVGPAPTSSYVEPGEAEKYWNLSGAPYDGSPDAVLANAGYDPSRGPTSRTEPGESVRQVTFQLSGSRDGSFDTFGYAVGRGSSAWIDEPAIDRRNGFDHPLVQLPAGSVGSYFLAIASGTWTRVADVPLKGIWPDSRVLASSGWGTLRLVGQKEQMEERGSTVDAHTKIWNSGTNVQIDIQPVREPRQFSYRLHFFDAQGLERTAFPRGGGRFEMLADGRRKSQLARVTLEVRRYHWLEFDGVHFDRDPAKWAGCYYGDEGLKASLHRSERGVELRSLARATGGTQFRPTWSVYAPDGKRWRAAPDHAQTQPYAGAPGYLTALFTLSKSAMNASPVRIEVYVASSATPGFGLGKRLLATDQPAWTRPFETITFPPPAPGSLVQIKVLRGTGQWRVVGTLPAPLQPVYRANQQDLAAFRTGTVYHSVYTLILRPEGHLAWYIDGGPPGETGIRWNPSSHRARIVAILKDGHKIEIQNNGASSRGDIEYHCDLTANSDAVLGNSDLLLSRIARFEVEAMDFEPPVFLPAVIPPTHAS